MTNSDLQSLGEYLQKAREERALSLQEVEAQTRIRFKFLEALENGDISILPTNMHARGFLRNYAQFLNLDVDEVIARFAEATGTEAGSITQVTTPENKPDAPPLPPASDHIGDLPEEQPLEIAQEGADDPPSPVPPVDPDWRPTARSRYISPNQRQGPGMPAGLRHRKQNKQPAQQQPSSPVQRPPAQSEPEAEVSSDGEERRSIAEIIHSPLFSIGVLLVAFVMVVWWVTSRLSQISGEQFVANNPQSEAVDATLTAEPLLSFTATATSPAAEESENASPQPQFINRVVLTIAVEQRSWTQIDVDGQRVYEGLAEQGQLLEYEANEGIFLRTGNAGGLLITFNGQEMGTLGERGEVVERMFTVSGMITPTPTPTSTLTPTGVPTPTLRPTFTPQN